MQSRLKLLLILYTLLLTVFAIFSFSLTDPNLVLTTWQPYWNFQQWMWQTFFLNRPLLTQTYTVLITLLFGVYALIFWTTKEKSLPKFSWLILLISLPLFFSYNALSHDVFNYIFNAKMMVVYHANPHIQVALNFPNDPWTRFMHNTHTTAPYGYGWTLFSLLPYMIGSGKFLITWLSFRLASIISFVLCIAAIKWTHRQISSNQPFFNHNLWLLCLNPLLLIEVISNTHNDLWMMAAAITSFGLVWKLKNISSLSKRLPILVLSAVLLLLSISVKFGTATLLPLWFLLIASFLTKRKIIGGFSQLIQKHWASIAAVCMFIPLVTDRSQQFNPWYWSWVLVWLPFIQLRWLKAVILAFSVSSLFRYIPWLWAGEFTDQIILQQKLITWVGAIGLSLILILLQPKDAKMKA